MELIIYKYTDGGI